MKPKQHRLTSSLVLAAIVSGGWATTASATLPGYSDDFDNAATLSGYTDLGNYSQMNMVNGQLIVRPQEQGWYQSQQGTGMLREFDGDFLVEVEVNPHLVGDQNSPPNGAWTGGGILVRSPDSNAADEDWLAYFAGRIGFGGLLATEIKTTQNSASALAANAGGWRGRLRVCRIGNEFRMYRQLEGMTEWQEEPQSGDPGNPMQPGSRIQRDDLTGPVQVGLMGTAWGDDDVEIAFNYLHFDIPEDFAACASNEPLSAPLSLEFSETSDLNILNETAPGCQGDVAIADGLLSIQPQGNNHVWYNNLQGCNFQQEISGDFVAEVNVDVFVTLDPEVSPGFDWKVGGILVRDPASDLAGESENWVVYNIGAQGPGGGNPATLGTERKTTVDTQSVFRYRASNDGVLSGRLRICRIGNEYHMLRWLDNEDGWNTGTANTNMDNPLSADNPIVRPDLPDTVQVGVMTNSMMNADDITVHFDYLRIARPEGQGDCESESLIWR